MFTLKYRPNTIQEFIGNKNNIQPFIRWLLEWDTNNKKEKCLLISGINGIGKSLLVELIIKKHDYNIINLSIDEDRDKESINQIIKPLLRTKKTFNGQENVLVVSDIDCSGSDYGFISSLTECIKETQIPIICICDDRYSQNIKPILNYCKDLKLVKPSYEDIYRLIYKVVSIEQIKIGKSGVEKLYEQSNGDIRFILNSLQLGNRKVNGNKNIQNINIFDTTGKLLNMDLTIDEKLHYYWMANDIHTLMIHENYINHTFTTTDEVKKIQNLSYSADSLSDVDLMDSIFDFDLACYVASNTIKATTKCNKKGQIKFPQFLGKISSMNKNKRENNNYENVVFFEKQKIKLKSKKLSLNQK
jgi:replication factor C subunit 1